MTAVKLFHKNSTRVIMLLVVVFVAAQFLILALVGTKGAEITSIRDQKDQLRVENEYLSAEIDKARTSGQIETGLNQAYDLQSTNVNVIQQPTKTSGDALSYLPTN